jgi:hypothetical protein
MQRKRLWVNGIFLCCLVAMMAALLLGRPLSPERAQALCLFSFKLPGPFRLLLNCDSAEFLRMANTPSSLFEPDNVRRSRPLFIILGYISSYVMAPLAHVLQPLVPDDPGPTLRNADKLRDGLRAFVPVYFGFVTINILAIFMSFRFYIVCMDRIIPPPNQTTQYVRISLLVGLLFIYNDVVKAFIWSPHLQMLHVLIPALGTYLIISKRIQTSRSFIFFSFITGISLLIYPGNIIVLPCIYLSYYASKRAQGIVTFVLASLPVVFSAAIICSLPSLAWYVVLKNVVGSLDFVETSKYGEVVWIAQAWREGIIVFIEAASAKFWFFLHHAAEQAIPIGIIFMILAFLVKMSGAQMRTLWNSVKPVALPACLVSAICLVFYTIVGWSAPRLAYAAIPPLVILCGIAAVQTARLSRETGRRVEIAIACVVGGQMIYTILKAGPLS